APRRGEAGRGPGRGAGEPRGGAERLRSPPSARERAAGSVADGRGETRAGRGPPPPRRARALRPHEPLRDAGAGVERSGMDRARRPAGIARRMSGRWRAWLAAGAAAGAATLASTVLLFYFRDDFS